MSLYLHNLVEEADLPPGQRAVLSALCDAAGEDDGTHCFPSQAYLVYKSRLQVRQVRNILRVLEQQAYIEPVAYPFGGRGKHTAWIIHVENVPMRPTWKVVKAALLLKGAYDDPFAGEEAQKAAIIAGEEAQKAAIIAGEEAQKAAIIAGERRKGGNICRHSTLSKEEDLYREKEDSYAPAPKGAAPARAPSPSESPSDPEPPEPDEPPDPVAAFDRAYPDVTAWARKTGRRWYATARENEPTKLAYMEAYERAVAARAGVS